jgi:hypothetical protein
MVVISRNFCRRQARIPKRKGRLLPAGLMPSCEESSESLAVTRLLKNPTLNAEPAEIAENS